MIRWITVVRCLCRGSSSSRRGRQYSKEVVVVDDAGVVN